MNPGAPGEPWVTAVSCEPPAWTWAPGDGFFFLGSCFAQTLCEGMKHRGLGAWEGPFGQIYNPESLAEALGVLTQVQELNLHRLFYHQGRWRHPLFHTLKSHPDRQTLERELTEGLEQGRRALAQAEFLVLTLGTSWVWRHRGDGTVWSNCHGVPAQEFVSGCGDLEAQVQALGSALSAAEHHFPKLKVILTLSPVRHLAQGLPANSLSKAQLRILISRLEGPRRWYFPAYEIFMDELRDYRWYQEDLVHPSLQAQRVIIQRFVDLVGQESLKRLWHRAGKVWALQSHRPRFPEGAPAQAQKVAQAWEAIKQDYPFLRPPSGV